MTSETVPGSESTAERESMVRYSVTGSVAEVVLDAPVKRNAVAAGDLADLVAALGELAPRARAGEVRALVFRGEGKAFCAGRDLAGVDVATDDALGYLAESVTPAMRAIADFPAPTFAAAHGAALGVGLGLLLATDVVYVASDAKFGSPFGKLGCALDSGGHWEFVERLGVHRTLDLIYTSDFVSGEEAVRAGLFSRAFAAEELLERTREIAARVAAGPTNAYLADRALVHRIRDERLGFWDALNLENKIQGELCQEPNYFEGIAAFQERRSPKFS